MSSQLDRPEILRSPLERLHWLRQVAASEVPGAATRVAIVIASHINAESGWCHPSSETIGREANVTNVRRATGELKDAGFLIIKPRRGWSNQYALAVPDNQSLGRITIVQGGRTTVTQGVDNCDAGGRTTVIPKQDKEQGKEQEPPDGALDVVFYREGKALLGPNATKVLTRLKSALGIDDARKLIAVAKDKADPREYVLGAIRQHLRTIRQSETRL